MLAMSVSTALLLGACGSDKEKAETTTAGTAAAAGTATTAAPSGDGSGISIYVIGGKSDDPFWSKVKRGVDDAALAVKANGGTVTWLGPQNYDNLGPDAAKLAQTALSQNASALIAADWVPDAQDETLTRVAKSGTALFLYNSGGLEAADKVGALTYIGSEEYEAGKAGGEFAGESGVKNMLCVNTLPGATNTEARCKGIGDGLAESGGKMTQLPLPSSNFGNPTAVAQAIKAAILADSTVDGVVTIRTGDADSAASALEQAGVTGKVQLGTFDMNETQLSRVKDSKQLFCIDQQPYLQGYLAVSLAYQYLNWGLFLPQRPILTGPLVIKASNVEQAIAGAAAGIR